MTHKEKAERIGKAADEFNKKMEKQRGWSLDSVRIYLASKIADKYEINKDFFLKLMI